MFLGTMGGRHVIQLTSEVTIVTGASWSTTVHYRDAQMRCDLKATMIDQGSIVRECLSGLLNGVQIEREFLHAVRNATTCQTREIESAPDSPETLRERVEALAQLSSSTEVQKLDAHRRPPSSPTTDRKQVG